MNHKQTTILVYGEPVQVDTNIAPLLDLLNNNGFQTELSCEDNDGTIWISFPHISLAEELMQYILTHDKNLYEYMETEADWTTVFHEEGKLDSKQEFFIGNGKVEHSISLRFPKENYTQVYDSLHKIFNPGKLHIAK